MVTNSSLILQSLAQSLYIKGQVFGTVWHPFIKSRAVIQYCLRHEQEGPFYEGLCSGLLQAYPPNGVRFLWEQGKTLFRDQAGIASVFERHEQMSTKIWCPEAPSTTTIYAPLSLEACLGISVCRVVVGAWPRGLGCPHVNSEDTVPWGLGWSWG